MKTKLYFKEGTNSHSENRQILEGKALDIFNAVVNFVSKSKDLTEVQLETFIYKTFEKHELSDDQCVAGWKCFVDRYPQLEEAGMEDFIMAESVRNVVQSVRNSVKRRGPLSNSALLYTAHALCNRNALENKDRIQALDILEKRYPQLQKAVAEDYVKVFPELSSTDSEIAFPEPRLTEVDFMQEYLGLGKDELFEELQLLKDSHRDEVSDRTAAITRLIEKAV